MLHCPNICSFLILGAEFAVLRAKLSCHIVPVVTFILRIQIFRIIILSSRIIDFSHFEGNYHLHLSGSRSVLGLIVEEISGINKCYST